MDASRWGKSQQLTAPNSQPSNEDFLLALNRLMGLAPASNRSIGGAYVEPIVPSQAGALRAVDLFNQSGAAEAKSREEQLALVQQLLKTLGL